MSKKLFLAAATLALILPVIAQAQEATVTCANPKQNLPAIITPVEGNTKRASIVVQFNVNIPQKGKVFYVTPGNSAQCDIELLNGLKPRGNPGWTLEREGPAGTFGALAIAPSIYTRGGNSVAAFVVTTTSGAKGTTTVKFYVDYLQ